MAGIFFFFALDSSRPGQSPCAAPVKSGWCGTGHMQCSNLQVMKGSHIKHKDWGPARPLQGLQFECGGLADRKPALAPSRRGPLGGYQCIFHGPNPLPPVSQAGCVKLEKQWLVSRGGDREGGEARRGSWLPVPPHPSRVVSFPLIAW